MNEKIKSITEAFSQQPYAKVVVSQEYYENTLKHNNNYAKESCKEILLEKIEIGKRCDDPVEELYYVGYNFDGQKIFQYIANSVNIEYFTN